MWIRSQDRKILTKIDDLDIDGANQIWGDCCLLGKYSSEEKALEVLDEKTCENLSEYNLCDRFECSNCGIVLAGYLEIKVDEDDDTSDECTYEYTPKYCPNCGRKIID